MRHEVDFLIIGSGIAGLSFALKVADQGKVCILTKADASEGSTRYAQGGIAAVMYDSDSFEKHIQDTLVAGDGICDREVVEMTIREAPERIAELVRYGVNFDRSEGDRFDLHREGGHSEYRILHHKDNTGAEIERGLLQAAKDHPNIEIKEHQFAIDIITQHHLGQRVTKHTPDIECYGVYALDCRTNRIDDRIVVDRHAHQYGVAVLLEGYVDFIQQLREIPLHDVEVLLRHRAGIGLEFRSDIMPLGHIAGHGQHKA